MFWQNLEKSFGFSVFDMCLNQKIGSVTATSKNYPTEAPIPDKASKVHFYTLFRGERGFSGNRQPSLWHTLGLSPLLFG